MSGTSTIHLGYEVGTGQPVAIPIRNMVVTGQTQEAGKTTLIEALAARSGIRAATFVTKRGEGAFRSAARIAPYFREQADWQYVASILEASRGEKLKYERASIIKMSKGARTLADVQRNIRQALAGKKPWDEKALVCLDAYLDVVVPLIDRVQWARSVDLRPGVNAVDLSGLATEMQHLVIRSTLGWLLDREQHTVAIVPEAWKFIPQGRGTPVKLAAEELVRQGSGLRNYLWLDSQDIAGVEKIILKSCPVWLLGVQREANEVKRTLDNIPASVKRPKTSDVATLGLGQFYACWGTHTVKTYVQPAWMSDADACAIALGEKTIDDIRPPARQPIAATAPIPPPPHVIELPRAAPVPSPAPIKPRRPRVPAPDPKPEPEGEDEMSAAAEKKLDTLIELMTRQITGGASPAPAAPPPATSMNGDEEAMYQRFKLRLLAEVPAIAAGGAITVTPPEKLRKDFQRQEVDRMVAAAKDLPSLAKKVLRFLEGVGGYHSQKAIAARLGRSLGGGSMTDMSEAVKVLQSAGFVTVNTNGVTKRLRDQIASDLSTYQPSDAEVETVYQNVLYELATDGGD